MLLLLLIVASAGTMFSFSPTSDALLAPRHRYHNGTGTANSSCFTREREALLAFKQAISSDPAGRLALAHGTKVNKTAADGEASGATTTPATLWRFSFATRKPMISKILIGMRLWEAR